MVPAGEVRRFIERVDLDWPIETLEPLSFVLARMFDALSQRLEDADRGAVEITVRLQLVTRQAHERTLHLPAPMRDARVLRTVVALDLESHPPAAAIDVVEIELGVAPGRIAQGALFTRTRPAPEALATLLARLRALMGESRVGAPALVESYDERQSAMETFEGHRAEGKGHREGKGQRAEGKGSGLPLIRRYRPPIAVRVATERGRPVALDRAAGFSGGRILAAAGPWRSSGRWWALDRTNWDRDDWDVEFSDGAYRLTRDRATGRWEIEGNLD
jgi:protein ImuB